MVDRVIVRIGTETSTFNFVVRAQPTLTEAVKFLLYNGRAEAVGFPLLSWWAMDRVPMVGPRCRAHMLYRRAHAYALRAKSTASNEMLLEALEVVSADKVIYLDDMY